LTAENISKLKELHKNELYHAMDMVSELEDLNVNIKADWLTKRPEEAHVQIEFYTRDACIILFRLR